MFALHDTLQAGKSIPRWNSRARTGINLGNSPRHIHTVSLVLNTNTRLVSPQYHVTFDELFDTVRHTQAAFAPTSYWQHVCGLRPSADKSNAPAIFDIFTNDDVTPWNVTPNQDVSPTMTSGQTREAHSNTFASSFNSTPIDDGFERIPEISNEEVPDVSTPSPASQFSVNVDELDPLVKGRDGDMLMTLSLQWHLLPSLQVATAEHVE